MAIIDFKDNENLVSYMLTELRLSRIDHKFLESLRQYARTKKQITSNQDNLFKKILGKYHRQFIKKEFFLEKLLSLNWSCTVVPSSPLYTEAYLLLENNKIIFRSPFNREFVNDLKKNPIYSMKWIRENKQYELDYGTSILRDLITITSKHFPKYNLCPILKNIIDETTKYSDVKYWDPTLVASDGKLFLYATNNFLMDSISDIDFNFDIKTIADLTQYGINIDASVTDYIIKNTNILPKKVQFASQFNPVVEKTDMAELINWLKEFEVDAVMGHWNSTEITDLLKLAGISSYNMSNSKLNIKQEDHNKIVMFNFKSFDLAYYKPYRFYKLVKFVNSQPITIK